MCIKVSSIQDALVTNLSVLCCTYIEQTSTKSTINGKMNELELRTPIRRLDWYKYYGICCILNDSLKRTPFYMVKFFLVTFLSLFRELRCLAKWLLFHIRGLVWEKQLSLAEVCIWIGEKSLKCSSSSCRI